MANNILPTMSTMIYFLTMLMKFLTSTNLKHWILIGKRVHVMQYIIIIEHFCQFLYDLDSDIFVMGLN